MTNVTLEVRSAAHKEVALRTISVSDLSNLRTWKNGNKASFFDQREISTKQQHEWFSAYQRRNDDCMFIVEYEHSPVGCMGFRQLDDSIDIYNVIRGSRDNGRATMSFALEIMIAHIATSHPGVPITSMVLKDNPALDWYLRNGFKLNVEHETHWVIRFSEVELIPSANW